MRRPGLGVLGCLVGMGLVVGGVSPVWASESGPADGSALVGGFGLGDGLEASIDEPSGAFKLALPAGGLNLGWDSRALGANLFGLGEGWSFGLARIQVDGGVTVFPASGGSYPADTSTDSGLGGYTLADTRFEQTPGVLPAEGDRPEVAYAYSLHELGGSSTYFNDAGDQVAHRTSAGGRTSWVWEPGHRLVQVIDVDGVATSLTWTGSTLVVRPGSNLPGGGDAWVVELQNDRVAAAVDPEGGRTQVVSEPSGLVVEVAGESGARTAVEWRAHDDGVARVERLATFGGDGAELSSRTWQPAGAGVLSSGWPAVDAGVSTQGVAFSSVVGDGRSELVSSYNALGSLVSRVMSGSTSSGRQVLQEQTFRYPGTDEYGVPAVPLEELPKAWANPSEATVTFRDAVGGARSGSQHSEFDEFGRLVSKTSADGVQTSYEYDPGEPGSVLPPVGLLVGERTVAPDGLVAETAYELNEAGTAVVAETSFTGREGEPLVELGRVEYTVEDDGFVSERREFPAPTTEGAAEVEPRVAAWSKEVDLAAGVMRLSETIGVGTELEASTSSTVSLVHDGVLSQTDELGNTMTASYDRVGRVVSAVDAVGRQVTSSYESAVHDGRNATTVTGPDGVAVTEVSDEFGRVLQVTDNIRDGVVEPGFTRFVEQREYPVPGLVRVTDAWGAVSSKRVDVFGRTVETIAPTGLRSVSVHDDVAGTVTTGLTPSGDLADGLTTSTTVTDEAGRVTAATGSRADGVQVPEIGSVYDGLGRTVQTTGGPLQTATTFDEYGRQAEQTLTPTASEGEVAPAPASASDSPDAGAMTVTHEFDVYGTPVRRTVADSAGSSYSGAEQRLDVLGRTTAETDQAGVTSSTEFTPDGLVASAVTTTGHETRFEYHEQTRALLASTTTGPDGGVLSEEYLTDPVTGQVTAMFDPADRAGTEMTYTYDAFGNVLTVTYPDGEQVGYDYDANGRREQVTDTAGNITRYAYDDAGILTGVTQTGPDAKTVLASVAYTYDDFGRLVDAARGNGVTTTYEYDAVNAITRETTNTNGVVTADRSYTYDATGRLTQRTDRISDDEVGEGAAGDLVATTTSYTYDSFDRLTGSSVHDGDTTAAPVTRTTAYVNTVAGDVERETVTEHPGSPDETSTVRAFEYDPAGALTAVTTTTPEGSTRSAQQYDANGNLTRDLDGTTYTYDADNRVTGHTTAAGITTSIGYWIDGSRRHLTTTRSGETVTTGFYWDGDTLLNDTHASPRVEEDVTASYLIGTSRHARTLTGDATGEPDTSYLGTDRHGNTTELTDQHGAVTTRYAYTDYGTTTTLPAAGEPAAEAAPNGVAASAARNPFQYAAAYADPAGTLHLDVRDYRPATMRFDTPDTAKELTNYAYGDLNPVMKADPSGRSAIGDHVLNGALAIVGLVAGIAAGVALGFPTGGMSWTATAWYVTAAVAIAGDFVSTGIAVAQIVDAAGPRFIRDQDRESLRISGIVIGAVAGFVSGAATYMYRARVAADAAGPVAAAPPPPGPTNSFSHHKSVKGTIKDLQERLRKNLDVIEFDARSARYLTTGEYTNSYNAVNNFVVSLFRKKKPGIETLKRSRWFNGAGLLKREELKTTEQWLKHWDEAVETHHQGMMEALKVWDNRSALLSGGNHSLPVEQIPGSINREAGEALWNASNSIRKDLDDALDYIETLRANRAERDALQGDLTLIKERIDELK